MIIDIPPFHVYDLLEWIGILTLASLGLISAYVYLEYRIKKWKRQKRMSRRV